MIPFISNFRNKRNLCCGVTLIVLNAIAWPSFLVWVLIDVGLAFVLIVPRVLQLTKKTSRVDSTTSGDVKRGRGDFSSAMSEALNGHLRNSEGSRRIRPGSRHNYNHDFSRCTPDERDTRTPLPTISAIRNRLSYRYGSVYSNILMHTLVTVLALQRRAFVQLLQLLSIPTPIH